LPQIQFVFFSLPSANDSKKDIPKFCHDQMTLAQVIWNPKEFAEVEEPVTFAGNTQLKTVADKNNEYKLIEIASNNDCPKGRKLVAENWTKQAGPIIPVFVCWAAWKQGLDGDKVVPGVSRGFTLTKRGCPTFTGDRAILLFITTAVAKTLAHELHHWFGYIHKDVAEDKTNVGIEGGGGSHVGRDQYHSMSRFAKDPKFRERL
jgi:hypothetical protein